MSFSQFLGWNLGPLSTTEKHFGGWEWQFGFDVSFGFLVFGIHQIGKKHFPYVYPLLRVDHVMGWWNLFSWAPWMIKNNDFPPNYCRLFCLSILCLPREIIRLMVKWPPCICIYYITDRWLTHLTLGHSSHTVCCIIWKRPGPSCLVVISCRQLHFLVPLAGLITGLFLVIFKNPQYCFNNLIGSLVWRVVHKDLSYWFYLLVHSSSNISAEFTIWSILVSFLISYFLLINYILPKIYSQKV